MSVRLAALASAVVLVACGQNNDPAGAKDLYDRVSAANYRVAWKRAPEFPSRKPSFTDHSDAVEIFVDPNMSKALAGPDPIKQWPIGAIIVKESYANNTLNAFAMMEKKPDGSWFFAEYNADGKALYSGKPGVCVDCHDNRKGYSDWVYAIELPK